MTSSITKMVITAITMTTTAADTPATSAGLPSGCALDVLFPASRNSVLSPIKLYMTEKVLRGYIYLIYLNSRFSPQ